MNDLTDNLFSPNGAHHDSPRQRPGKDPNPNPTVKVFSTNGAHHDSPGQRPGENTHPTSKALKGRPNLCPSPWPACTHTLFSAPKTAIPASPMPCVTHCMPTWLPFCKTFTARPFSSTRWKITSISFSTWLGQLASVKSWRTSKNPPPNGSKLKEGNSPHSLGSLVTEPSPFPNRMWKLSANTLPTNANTTAQKHFKKNTGHFLFGTISHSMNDMFGIDSTLGHCCKSTKGAALGQPKAMSELFSTNGAELRLPKATPEFFNTNGATIRQPRATRWGSRPPIHRGPTVRPKCRASVRAGFQPSMIVRGANLGRCPRLAWGRALPLEKGGLR